MVMVAVDPERLRHLVRIAEIATAIRDFDNSKTKVFLEANGWSRRDDGYWTHPKHFKDFGCVHPDTALNIEMDFALSDLHETGG